MGVPSKRVLKNSKNLTTYSRRMKISDNVNITKRQIMTKFWGATMGVPSNESPKIKKINNSC